MRLNVNVSANAVVSKGTLWLAEQFLAAAAECRAVEARGDDLSRPLNRALDSLYVLLEPLPSLKQSAEIRALRFARARSVHQQASVVFRVDEGPTTWRPVSHLPKPDDMKRHWDDEGARQYETLLAGKPALAVLEIAERVVKTAT